MLKTLSTVVMAAALMTCLAMPKAFAEDPAPAAAAATPAADAPYHDSSPDEAMAWAKKAAQFVKDHGAEEATKVFNDPHGEFVKGDLYVFVNNKAGDFLAHPIKPALVGKNAMDMKDIDGTPLVKLFTEVEDEAWVAYKWPHPVTKKIRPKKSYIINVKGIPGGYYVGVGTYYDEEEKK